MVYWSELMPRITRGQQISYKPAFFSWLQRHLIVLKDWPYSSTDFCGDSDMLLPEREDYDDGGKRTFNFFFFDVFLLFLRYMCS